MLKNYKELKVWKKAYQLCIKIYKITKGFPKEERYGLTSQMRRAAVSVPSNIAEGYGRKTTQEYIQALYIAYGSNCELETQILLSGDLGFIKSDDVKNLQRDMGDIERMLKALIKSLENKPLNPRILGPFLPTNWEKTLNWRNSRGRTEFFRTFEGVPSLHRKRENDEKGIDRQ